jgi:hypothetical protein
MSEPKGLFDAAIKHLADSIRALEIHSPADTLGESRLYQKQASGLRIGLRVLEAAGKVDKSALRDFIHLYLADLDPNPILEFMETVYMALPDKEKK